MNVVTRGFRNTFRSGIRAFSIIAILAVVIGLALTMLIARAGVSDKIASVKSSIGNTITVSPAGVRGFEGGGNPLTASDVTKITSTPHVAATTSVLEARMSSSDTNLQSALSGGPFGQRGDSSVGPSAGGFGGNFTPSVQVTGTTNSTNLSQIGTVSLASGSQIDANGSANEALIGQDLATKNNLSAGSTFTAYGQTITVKGIINSTNDRFAGNAVIMPLKTLQTLANEAGDVSSVIITVDSIDNEANVTSALQSALGSSADVVSAQSRASDAVQPLQSIENLSIFVLLASVVVGAVVILLIMVMIVRERRREVGVMKAIGASNGTISAQFMVEAATLTILAAILGIVLSILMAGPITNMLVSNASSQSSSPAGSVGFGRGGFARRFGGSIGNAARSISSITTHIDWTIVLYGFGAALVIALVGSLVASLFISKIKPAEAVRAE